jgi:hypothetical protein
MTGTRHEWKRSRVALEVLDEFAKKHLSTHIPAQALRARSQNDANI